MGAMAQVATAQEAPVAQVLGDYLGQAVVMTSGTGDAR